MIDYIGIKNIKAEHMTRQEYNDYRGWTLPADENPEDQGYLVENTESTNSNHKNHQGYISWSPKNVFEQAYNKSGDWDFSKALHALKQGFLISRSGWNGKGMFLYLVWGCEMHTDIPAVQNKQIQPFIMMKTAQDTLVPWLCSQSDALANDWGLAEL